MNDLQICFLLQTACGSGTAFIYDAGRGAVLVTAGHLMEGVQPGENVLLRRGGREQRALRVQEMRRPAGYDLSVFSVANLQYPGGYLQEKHGPIPLGGRVIFAGFPHGLFMDNPTASEGGFVTPLVRTAYLSGSVMIDGKRMMVLDGFNNPGYSGAPAFAQDLSGKTGLVGVVVRYRTERADHARIYRRNAEGVEEELPDLYVKPNRGMIYAIPAVAVHEIYECMSSFLPPVRTSGPAS